MVQQIHIKRDQNERLYKDSRFELWAWLVTNNRNLNISLKGVSYNLQKSKYTLEVQQNKKNGKWRKNALRFANDGMERVRCIAKSYLLDKRPLVYQGRSRNEANRSHLPQ